MGYQRQRLHDWNFKRVQILATSNISHLPILRIPSPRSVQQSINPSTQGASPTFSSRFDVFETRRRVTSVPTVSLWVIPKAREIRLGRLLLERLELVGFGRVLSAVEFRGTTDFALFEVVDGEASRQEAVDLIDAFVHLLVDCQLDLDVIAVLVAAVFFCITGLQSWGVEFG